MASFSSKYNRKLNNTNENSRFNKAGDEYSMQNKQYTSNNRGRNRNNQGSSTQYKSNTKFKKTNNSTYENRKQGTENRKTKNNEPVKQETPYKSAVSNIPSIKQVQNNYLSNKSVYLPDVYKQTSTTKLNNVNQLLILKEVKWGEI